MLVDHGLPYNVVTDDASYFTLAEFSEFLTGCGILHKTSLPNFPSTNGIAERTVQTMKKKILKMLMENPANLATKLQQIVFQYRTTPLECGKTPAELHCGRQLRTCLHLLIPSKSDRSQYHADAKQIIRTLTLGQKVISRHYRGTVKWKFGTIQKKLGYRTYLVRLETGQIIKRNIDQLKAANVAEKHIREAPEVETTEPEIRRSTRMRKPVTRLTL
jgi:hypothetical protein